MIQTDNKEKKLTFNFSAQSQKDFKDCKLLQQWSGKPLTGCLIAMITRKTPEQTKSA